MKIRYIYSALMCACIAFTGCSDDVLEENYTPWNEGDGIIFGARAGYESDADKSRTQYTGEHYNYQGKDFERIEWVPRGNGKTGDHISIYCPEAYIADKGKDFFVDYVVTEHKTSQNAAGQNTADFATLAPASKSTLQWGASDNHTFYACYPTEASTTQTDAITNKVRSAVKLSKIANNPDGGLHFEGRVPANQIPKQISSKAGNGGKVYVAEPYMENAHMVAVNTVSKLSGKPVDLTFKSISTVLELHLTGNTSLSTVVTGVMIGSADPNQRVAGKYECDITSGEGYPVCTNVATSAAGNQVMIPLLQKDAQNNVRGIMLNPSDTLTLTVFLLPTADLDNLVLTVITPSGRQSHAIVKGQGAAGKITFTAHKKHYLKNIKLPASFNSADWMSRVDNNVYLHQLSIPGSGNSFSYNYKGADPTYYKTQGLPIKEQWDMGVRCFEVTSDRKIDWSDLGYIPSIGDRELVGEGTVGTVKQAVDAIADQIIAHPSEFAIVIMNYQPSKSRKADSYIEQCDKFITAYKKVPVKTYNSNIILSEARGGIFFILRPTSDGEDALANLSGYSASPYIIVEGWGSLHDKWKQRGYANVTNNSGKLHFNESYERFMLKEINVTNGYIDPKFPEFSLPKKGTADYTYQTNVANTSVWAQEWNRVVLENTVKYLGTRTDFQWGNTQKYNLYAAWKESYSEKLEDAKQTFRESVSGSHPNMLFINCLTGYLVDFANKDQENFWVPNHHYPNWGPHNGGKYGDVIAFSQKINKDFYQFMWGQWVNRINAPMGIVMMNQVGVGTTDANPENFYMPTIVVSNNFSFPLQTRSGSTNQ